MCIFNYYHRMDHLLHHHHHLLRKTITQNLTLLSLISLLFLPQTLSADSSPNTAVLSVLCNSQSYTKGDPFTISLSYVLVELESVTPTRRRYDFYNISPYPNAFAYGHATCNQTLTPPGCAACIAAAKTAMLGTCAGQIGARGVLFDCSIRYEQYPFHE